MLRLYENPGNLWRRYLLASGTYPEAVRVKTPLGTIELTAYSWHDILTINEVFCRHDYPATDQAVIVDFGSNIGISAAYFLTRNPGAFVYLYEPLPQNVERLKPNLKPFEGRYTVAQVAVATQQGTAEFGWEPTGRYGALGSSEATRQSIQVACVDSNDVLRTVIAKHGRIDMLKLDIEGLEQEIVARIPTDLAPHIGRIYAECRFDTNPLSQTHTYTQYGSIARLIAH